MSKNTTSIPFTEIVERSQVLSRSAENNATKIRGVINDIYAREIPFKSDWAFLYVSSGITTTPEYKTGTVSATTGSNVLSFANATITQDMTGRKIKISGNDVVYDFTYTDATGGTVNPYFEGQANASGNSFSLFRPFYALSEDFERFPKNSGFYRWQGGRKIRLEEKSYGDYVDDYTSGAQTPTNIRLVHKDTAGKQLIEMINPPSLQRNYAYDYIRQLRPLTETTAGSVSISAQGTIVTGHNSKFTEATTGDWLRIEAFGTHEDSSWYKISQILNDTSIRLSSAFANSAVTSAGYVICSNLEVPERLQMGVLYGTVRNICVDQNDDAFQVFNMKMAEVMSDAKVLYATRIYNRNIDMIAEDYMYRR